MAIFLSLGSNAGNKLQNLQNAINLLRNELHIKTNAISNIYETEPFGHIKQPWFYNIACSISTDITPCNLMLLCKSIEYALGRRKAKKWSERIIDIDILLYDSLIMSTNTLTVPHEFLPARHFVLSPLCDIAPRCVHPVLGTTICSLLQSCTDNSVVRKTNIALN